MAARRAGLSDGRRWGRARGYYLGQERSATKLTP
jgi:hypothetical protein